MKTGIKIRTMTENDRQSVVEMMRTFYSSDAVHTNGSEEIFNNDVSFCVGNSPYAQGFVFEYEGFLCGYGMVAKSFSTEFGKPCIWIEDIYVKPEYRGMGIGKEFFGYLNSEFCDIIFRLEAERANEPALALYYKFNFQELPYIELYRNN